MEEIRPMPWDVTIATRQIIGVKQGEDRQYDVKDQEGHIGLLSIMWVEHGVLVGLESGSFRGSSDEDEWDEMWCLVGENESPHGPAKTRELRSGIEFTIETPLILIKATIVDTAATGDVTLDIIAAPM